MPCTALAAPIYEADVKVVGAAKHSKYYKVHGKPKRKRMDKNTLLEMGIDPDFKRCVLESGHPSEHSASLVAKLRVILCYFEVVDQVRAMKDGESARGRQRSVS